MPCPERDIALYVEGDLAVADAAVIERHLETCPDCRALVEDLRQTQALLKSCAPPESLGEFVFVPPRRWRWLLWAAVPATVAAALLLAAGLRRPAPIPPPPAPVLAVAHPPELKMTPTPPAPRRRPHVQRPSPEEPLLVEMQTNDPDVVIYWIVEPKGE